MAQRDAVGDQGTKCSGHCYELLKFLFRSKFLLTSGSAVRKQPPAISPLCGKCLC